MHRKVALETTALRMELAEPLENVCRLCNNAFCQGTFVHKWIKASCPMSLGTIFIKHQGRKQQSIITGHQL